MSRNKGFTLIELMIAMAIIAIVAAIAYPAFTKSAMKGRRADAKAALTRHAQALERCYTQYGSYKSAFCTTEVDSSGNFLSGVQSDQKYYNITASGTDLSAISYTLTATAVSTGPQAKDTGCTVMTISSTGAQTPVGSCW